MLCTVSFVSVFCEVRGNFTEVDPPLKNKKKGLSKHGTRHQHFVMSQLAVQLLGSNRESLLTGEPGGLAGGHKHRAKCAVSRKPAEFSFVF